MNIKVTYSEITTTFTPDEWAEIRRILDFAVKDVEEQNHFAFEELAGLRAPSLKWWQLKTTLPNIEHEEAAGAVKE